MNRVNPAELLQALRATFGALSADAPWIDVPALVYALIAWESRFDLDAAVIEPDGSVSLGLGQINQKRWKSQLGTLPMPSTMQEQIDYMRPVVDSMVRNIAVAAESVSAREKGGETGLKFNPAFDGPLWGSIDWQYGGAALKNWAATPGVEMGENGFAGYRASLKDDEHPNGKPVLADFARRSAAIRAAYSTAANKVAIGAGLIAMSQRTGSDWVTGATEGLRRLAELTGVPTAIRESEVIGAHIEKYAADTLSGIERGMSNFAHGIEKAAEIYTAASLGLIAIGIIAVVVVLRSQNGRKAATYAARAAL